MPMTTLTGVSNEQALENELRNFKILRNIASDMDVYSPQTSAFTVTTTVK